MSRSGPPFVPAHHLPVSRHDFARRARALGDGVKRRRDKNVAHSAELVRTPDGRTEPRLATSRATEVVGQVGAYDLEVVVRERLLYLEGRAREFLSTSDFVCVNDDGRAHRAVRDAFPVSQERSLHGSLHLRTGFRS